MIHPVILSGGSGTRLWPMSRSLYPKQLLALTGERSLLQETARRVADDPGFAAPVIVANEEHRFIIAEQLREIGVAAEALMLEPIGRNTAPAACVAALRLTATQAAGEPETLMLVMPSDHAIGDLAAFRQATERAAAAARAGCLVTFGITPERAETGYGYIASGRPLDGLRGRLRGHRLCREARPGDRRALCRLGRVFLEQRHLPVPGVAVPVRAGAAAARHAGGVQGGARRRQDRDRFRPPRQGRVRRLPERFDRLRGHGAHARRRGRAGRHGVERSRLVGCAVGHGRQGRTRQRAEPAMSSPRRRATAICARRPGSSRRSGSRTSSSSRPTTRSWWRRATAPRR